MRDNYSQFRQTDKEKSRILAQNLAIPTVETQKIDLFFDEILSKHQKINDYTKETHHERLKQEQIFDKKGDELVKSLQNKSAYVYLMAKSMSFLNVFDGTCLTEVQIGGIFGVLLQKLFRNTNENEAVSSAQLVAIANYVKSPLEVTPNGDLLENLFQIVAKNKIEKYWKTAERQVFLSVVLSLISDKGFHHDIKFFKKVIKLIKAEDHELMAWVTNFEVKNQQGCYLVVRQLFSNWFSEDNWTDFARKNELLQLFDTASGSQPKEAWLKKYRHLATEIGSERLEKVARQVKLLERHRKYDHLGWTDDVVVRFLKASDFILGAGRENR